MPIKKDNLDSNPLPYCHISRPNRNCNLKFDNCFSPQAKNQSPIFSPRKPIKTINPGGHSNVSYPYYMPEEWFSVAPPMGLQVEEQQEEEEQNKDEITKLSKLSMPVKTPLPPPENQIGEMAERKKGRGLSGSCTTSRGAGHHGPVEELTHRLERFKIKTLQLAGGGVGVKK